MNEATQTHLTLSLEVLGLARRLSLWLKSHGVQIIEIKFF